MPGFEAVFAIAGSVFKRRGTSEERSVLDAYEIDPTSSGTTYTMLKHK